MARRAPSRGPYGQAGRLGPWLGQRETGHPASGLITCPRCPSGIRTFPCISFLPILPFSLILFILNPRTVSQILWLAVRPVPVKMPDLRRPGKGQLHEYVHPVHAPADLHSRIAVLVAVVA